MIQLRYTSNWTEDKKPTVEYINGTWQLRWRGVIYWTDDGNITHIEPMDKFAWGRTPEECWETYVELGGR